MSNEALIGKALGRSHVELVGGPVRLATTTGIDPFTPGDYTIYTGAASHPTAITLVVLRSTAAADITAPMTARVKVAGDSIFPPQELVGLTQAGKHWIFPSGQGTAPLVPPAGDLVLEITGAPTGTSQVIAVDVFGHEL